jgi:hypothetical protein
LPPQNTTADSNAASPGAAGLSLTSAPGPRRTAILIVNGFDRRGKWGEYNVEEALRFPWIRLCLEQLERHTEASSYDVLVWDNSFLPEHLEVLEGNQRVTVFSARDKCSELTHAQALDRLLREVPAESEYVVTLDTDSFPIRDAWLDNLLGRLDRGAWIAGVWRDEMAGAIRPYVHPSCLAARKDTLLELDAQFAWKRGVRQVDVGQSITNAVMAAGGRVSGLRRSNARNFHFLMAGIYGDLVYHHGAGSRRAHFWISPDRKADEAARVALRDAAFADLDRLIDVLVGDVALEEGPDLGLETDPDVSGFLGEPALTARRIQKLEERLEAVTARRVGHSLTPVLTNLEGRTEFNVRWGWSEGKLEPGFTAVVRVKNEAQSLPWVLPPLFRAVRQVVLIDNDSTDGTPDVARQLADEVGAADRIEVHRYPFAVARCGQEHLDTPAASVHSLAYFYNWSFSHVRTAFALKWDGDMVLTDTAVNVLRDLAWQLEASQAVVWIPRYPLFIADDARAFFDVGMRNTEPWGWPNRPGYSFVKAMDWELNLWRAGVPKVTLPSWACFELKYLGADEFDHWSHTDFDATERTERKLREWEVFHALAAGREPPADVEPVEAPDGQHVIDYVRSTWLPAKANQSIHT